jgi:hypothetical protein
VRSRCLVEVSSSITCSSVSGGWWLVVGRIVVVAVASRGCLSCCDTTSIVALDVVRKGHSKIDAWLLYYCSAQSRWWTVDVFIH